MIDTPFDLCILDGRTLQRLWQRIDARRTQETPRFLPFLLVTAREDVARAPDELWQRIDDVLVSPIHGRELWTRVTVLLRARQASVLLDQERQAFLKSEKRLNALVMASSDVIYRMSPDWSSMIQLSSTGFLVETNKPSQNWLQKYIHPDDQAHVMTVIHEAILTQSVFELEHRVLRADGRLGWIFSRAVPVLDEQGEISEWFGAASDVTARKQAEEALRESEARYHAFSEASTEGIAIHEHGIILEVNRIIADHLGYTPEEMVGQSLVQYIAPESREEVLRRMQAGDSGPYEAVSLHRDGSKTIGEMRARNFLYHDRPVRMVAMRDLTALKQAEAERERLLAEVQRRVAEMDATFSAIADGLIVYDTHGRVIQVNTVAQQYLGATSGQQDLTALDQAIHQRLQRPDGTRIAEKDLPVARALRGERVTNEILVWQQPEQAYWISASAAPIIDGDSRRFVVGMAVDITERKRYEEALQESDRAKDEFLAVLSHELQTPLTNMLGWSKMALDQPSVEVMTQALEVIHRNAVRQEHLVNELLDMSRIIHRKIELTLEQTDGQTAVQQAVENVQHTAVQRQITLIVSPQTTPLPIRVDPVRLQQCLGNLLQNSLKFTPTGGTITVSCHRDGGQVVLSVHDTGCGLPPEALPTLFAPFRQVNRNERTGGLGLGLAVVRGLAELHGGCVWAESPGIGQGSTFSLAFPLAEEALCAMSTADSADTN